MVRLFIVVLALSLSYQEKLNAKYLLVEVENRDPAVPWDKQLPGALGCPPRCPGFHLKPLLPTSREGNLNI